MTTANATLSRAPRKKRVLIVDDHPIIRHGVAALIQSEPDLEVCAEADSPHSLSTTVALRLARDYLSRADADLVRLRLNN